MAFLSYLLNSLIQISSSSKGCDFLWISPLSPLKSTTYELFKHVFRTLLSAQPDVHKQGIRHYSVDNSAFSLKLSPAFAATGHGEEKHARSLAAGLKS